MAGTAEIEAAALGLRAFAAVCGLLREDCLALRDEAPPDWREARLRELLAASPSAENRTEALVDLVQLMYRRGRYDESFRLAAALPKGRLGRRFAEVALIANGRADEVDWAALDGPDFGRLRAVRGLLALDASCVLAGPPPEGGLGLSPRHAAEWHVAFGWAHVSAREHELAAERLQSPFIHRSEWDLRLIRDACLLELHAAAPELARERCSVPGVAAEALWLARKRVAPGSAVLRLLPRGLPHAAALLLAAPGGCPPLVALARDGLAVAGAHGLTVGGVTYTAATSMARVAAGSEREPPALSPAAVRSARHRLGRALERGGCPGLASAGRVLRALENLAALAEGDERAAWAASAATYARA